MMLAVGGTAIGKTAGYPARRQAASLTASSLTLLDELISVHRIP